MCVQIQLFKFSKFPWGHSDYVLLQKQQVVADLYTPLAEAATVEQTQVAVAVHKDQTQQWLRRLRPGFAKAKAKKKAKVHRKKAFQWIVALDNTIWIMTGLRLADYVVKDEWFQNNAQPHCWNLLMGVADKGPDGVCAANFLKWVLRVCLDMWWDPSHGAWGSCRYAVEFAGLGVHIFLMMIAMNCGQGEWKDGVRGCQVRTATVTVSKSMSCSENMPYQWCLPGIIKEKCWDRYADDPSFHEGLYEHQLTGGMWEKDHQKANMRDFFGLIKRFDMDDSINWSEKLYGLKCACVEMDLWQKLEDAPADAAAPAQDKRTKLSFAQSKKDAFAIKRAAGNPIYHAYLMYADQENLMKMHIILTVTRPLHRWHQCQNVELRSVETGQKWLIQQCNGGFMKHVQATVDVVHCSNGSYEKMGVQQFDFDPAANEVDGAECAQQDALSAHIGDMALGCAGSRLNWGADFMHGIQKRFALLCGEHVPNLGEVATKLCNDVQIDVGLLEWAMGQTYNHIKQWAK